MVALGLGHLAGNSGAGSLEGMHSDDRGEQ